MGFEGLSDQLVCTVRSDAIDMVLATDMTVHFSKVGSFVELTARLGDDPEEWYDDERAMSAFRSILLHSVDISNQTKPFTLAQNWTRRVLLEFFAQGDEESQLGLPISPLCDRHNTNIAESQIGFIEFIVQPTFEAMAGHVQFVKDCCLKELSRSKQQWEDTGQHFKLTQ